MVAAILKCSGSFESRFEPSLHVDAAKVFHKGQLVFSKQLIFMQHLGQNQWPTVTHSTDMTSVLAVLFGVE